MHEQHLRLHFKPLVLQLGDNPWFKLTAILGAVFRLDYKAARGQQLDQLLGAGLTGV